MAVTQIHAIKTTLSKAIDYISNPDKTDDKLLIYGFNCTPEMAAYEFNYTKKTANKQGGNLAYHLIQSFAPGEVDYETAHKIGKQLADKHLGGKFEYVIATHIDCGHIHNHIIFNSVPFSGKYKYRSTMRSYFRIREISDRLCYESNLSVIEPSGDKGKCYKEYAADKQRQSWKSKLRETIDLCILKARNYEEFLALMEAEQYEIKRGKHISFKSIAFTDDKGGQERFTRAKTLGERYTEENIKARIIGANKKAVSAPATQTAKPEKTGVSLFIDIENNIKIKRSAGLSHWAKVNNLKMAAMTINCLSDNNLLDYSTLSEKHSEIKAKQDTTLARIREIESRIKELDSQIKDIDTYRKSKSVVEKIDTVVFKDKYKREHETEFILFNAAKQSLNVYFPNGKLPLIKTLRTEMSELYSEKNKLYPEYYAAKNELKNISTMKSNVDTILGREPKRDTPDRDKNKNALE